MTDSTPLVERIRKLREQRGWSQRQLAARAGLKPAHVNFIEAGKRRPKLDTLIKLAGALSVPLDELIHGEGVTEDTAPGEVEALIRRIAQASASGAEARETEEFLLMYWKLPPAVRRLMALQARTYSDLARQLETPTDNGPPSAATEGEAAGL